MAVSASVSRIAPSLQTLAIPIDSVALSPRNPREGDVGAIVASLTRFGQQKPIVVQASSGYVVAGNHLYRAAQELGWTEVAANVVDMSDREARAFMIADNRTSDLGSYDQDALAALLGEIATDEDLAGTGYDGDDVDELLSKMSNADSLGAHVAGSPVVSYTIIFDDEAQLERWNELLRELRRRWPDMLTLAARLDAWIGERP